MQTSGEHLVILVVGYVRSSQLCDDMFGLIEMYRGRAFSKYYETNDPNKHWRCIILSFVSGAIATRVQLSEDAGA